MATALNVYRRGATYWWRRRVPRRIAKKFHACELRLSLRTHIRSSAVARAARLRTLTDALFEELERIEVPLDDVTIDHLVAELIRAELDAAERRREMAEAREDGDVAATLAEIRARRTRLQEDLRLRRYQEADLALRRLLKAKGLDIDLQAPQTRPLQRRATRGLLAATHENERREQGIYTEPVQPAATAAGTHAAFVPSSPPPIADAPASCAGVSADVGGPSDTGSAASGIRRAVARSETGPRPSSASNASEATAKNTEGRKRRRGITLGDAWTQYIGEATSNDMRRHLESSAHLFTAILEAETPLAEITPQMVKEARDVLARLPKNHGKSSRDSRTPREAGNAADDRERDNMQALEEQFEFGEIDRKTYRLRVDQQSVPRISLNQVNNHLARLSGLLRWARQASFFDGHSPTEGLRFSKTEVARARKRNTPKNRLPWGLDGLRQLFATSLFSAPRADIGDPLFWAPLIAVHTGCRCEEILQAKVTDFETVEGVSCFHVRPGDGQRVKTENSERRIPIHSFLKEAGLLDLVQQRRDAGEIWLFPMVDRGAVDDSFTEVFTKRFRRYRQQNGVYRPENDFHSLRSDFNVQLARSGVGLAARQRLMGHQVTALADDAYDRHGEPMPTRQVYVDRIDLGLAVAFENGVPVVKPRKESRAA